MPMPAIMDAPAAPTNLHTFSPPVSTQHMKTINYPAIAIGQGHKRLQEPRARDWDELRPIVCALYHKYPLKKVWDILRYEHGFKIR